MDNSFEIESKRMRLLDIYKWNIFWGHTNAKFFETNRDHFCLTNFQKF